MVDMPKTKTKTNKPNSPPKTECDTRSIFNGVKLV